MGMWLDEQFSSDKYSVPLLFMRCTDPFKNQVSVLNQTGTIGQIYPCKIRPTWAKK